MISQCLHALTGTELITIGEDTTEADLQKFFMK